MRQFTRLLVWRYFHVPLYLAVDCSTLPVPEECIVWIIVGDDFRMDAVFSSLLGSSVDTSLRHFTCRARRRHRPWFVLAGFAGYDTLRAVFFDVDFRATPQVQFLVKVICLFGVFGRTAQKIVDFLQLLFIAGRRHPCHGAEADSCGFTVQ